MGADPKLFSEGRALKHAAYLSEDIGDRKVGAQAVLCRWVCLASVSAYGLLYTSQVDQGEQVCFQCRLYLSKRSLGRFSQT